MSTGPSFTNTEFNFSSGVFDRRNPARAGIFLNATVDLQGGGPDRRRGLDRVFGGWINNVNTQVPATARYTRDHSARQIYATNVPGNLQFLPGGAAPTLLATPILDTGRQGPANGGNTATLSTSDAARAPIPGGAKGLQFTVQAVDSPNSNFFLIHPGYVASLLTQVTWNHQFRAYLGLWTNVNANAGGDAAAANPTAANRLYSIAMQFDWTITATSNVDAIARTTTAVARPAITKGPVTISIPAAQGGATPIEIRPPVATDTSGFDYRN